MQKPSPQKDHEKYYYAWIDAMRFGLIDGRPFSEEAMRAYAHYVDWFLNQYKTVSVDTLRTALIQIPIEHFAKRQKFFQALTCYSKFLIEKKALPSKYLAEAKRYRPRRHLPERKFTVDQAGIDKLLGVCKKPVERLIVILLSQTGLRANEAASLKLSDLDLDNKTLTVRHAKWGKSRRVGLSDEVLNVLKEYLAVRPDHEENWLFINKKAERMDRGGLRSRLDRLGKLAGVKVSPHALRRAFVTLNANMGRPLVMLQIACGHNDIATTRSYCMTTEDETIEAMRNWQYKR